MKNNILLVIILTLGLGLFAAHEIKNLKKDGTDFPNNDFPNNPVPPANNPFPPIVNPNPVTPPPATPPAPITNPTSYQEAVQLSKQTNKKIVLMFSADWCMWCKKFKAETLPNSSVQNALKNYIFFIVDADQDKSTLSKFGVRGLPFFVITDGNENNLKSKAGMMSPEDFISFLNTVPSTPNPSPAPPPVNPPANPNPDDGPGEEDDRIIRRPGIIIRRPGGCGPGGCGPGCGSCGS